MSLSTNESEDGVLSNYQSESPLNDDTNGGSSGGGIVLKKGPWTAAEDELLVKYVSENGEGNWNAVQKNSGLLRCGKSCRLRWANHLRPNLKKGSITAEEEELIIQLHSQMGNKWARMAAHLPGRTDNEIKNYWNTRIKRRQRAGLPLYPDGLCSKDSQENQQAQNTGGINCGDRGNHDLSKVNSFDIPELVFANAMPYDLSDFSMGGLLMKNSSSSPYYSVMPPTIHCQKRLRESTDIFPDSSGSVQNGFSLYDQFPSDTSDNIASSFVQSFPHDLDSSKSLMPFGVTQGGHSLTNGNSSASRPIYGPVKSELPSLQYPQTDLETWGASPPPAFESVDGFIRSPSAGAFKPDISPPCNSGLLDALIVESNTRTTAKKYSSEKNSNSTITPGDMTKNCASNICETKWEDYREEPSPVGHFATSIFNGCISASGSSLDEPFASETFTGSSVKPEPAEPELIPGKEKKSRRQTDFIRPDVLLGSDWFTQSMGFDGNRTMHDPLATLLGEDYTRDYKHADSVCGNGSLSFHDSGYDSCEWNNMPGVCQMSDFP
ncbi:hypothetical protein UlMin_024965 [Ulmus minor]